MNANLPVQAIAADVCVAPQLNPESMAEAARLGFKSVVNNRPDFEGGPDQPTSAAVAAAAAFWLACQLGFCHGAPWFTSNVPPYRSLRASYR